MAGNAVIGALRVVLGADTAQLETGLKDAQGKLAGFGAGLGTAMAAAGVAVVAAAAAIGVAIKSSINDADKMGKMSQSIGVPVEELSKLNYAAGLSDVAFESLGVSLGKLAKNMSATAGGAGKSAAEAFKAMGIEVTNTDGTLRSSSDVLADIAGKFKGYEDGAAKTALAIAVFGKSGAAMIPLLNQGKDGLEKASAEAEKYGLVIGKDTAAAAEAFNNNLKRMSAINQGVWVQVTANILPAFQAFSQVMLDGKEKSSLMGVAVMALTNTLKALATSGVIINAVFKSLGDIVSSVASAVMLVAQGEFSKAWEAVKTGASGTTDHVTEAGKSIARIWGMTGAEVVASSADTGKKMAAPIIQATEKAKNALQSFLDSTAKRTAGLDAEAQTIGKSVFETDRLKVSLEAETIAKSNNITITEALRQKIDAAATAFATMSEKVQFGKQLFEATRTPVEQFGITMENLNGAMDRGAISADTYARGVAQAQDKLVQADPYAQAFGNSATSAFDKAIQGGTKLSDVLKGLLLDLSRAFLNQGFKALLFGNSGQGGTSSGLLGGLFGSIFGGGSGGGVLPGGAALGQGGIGRAASGGDFKPGDMSWVGEGGPELVRFNAPSQVIPNRKSDDMMGGSVTMSMPVTINAPGADPIQLARVTAELQSLKSTLPQTIASVNRTQRVRGSRV